MTTAITTPNTPLNDILQIGYTCAEFDLPFTAIYRRNNGGLYHLVKTEQMNHLDTSPTGIERALDVSMDYFAPDAFENFKCPWCGTAHSPTGTHFMQCGSCRSLICSATLDAEKNFTCPCGNSGRVGGVIRDIRAGEGGKTGDISIAVAGFLPR